MMRSGRHDSKRMLRDGKWAFRNNKRIPHSGASVSRPMREEAPYCAPLMPRFHLEKHSHHTPVGLEEHPRCVFVETFPLVAQQNGRSISPAHIHAAHRALEF